MDWIHGTEKKVKDIMLPIQSYATVFWEHTLQDALFVLKKSFYSEGTAGSQAHQSVLVFDNKKRLVGTLSFRDVIGTLHSETPIYPEGTFSRLYLSKTCYKVKDVMRPIGKRSVNSEDSILEAIYQLNNLDFELVPVEEKGDIIGMVRAVEIYREISNLVEANVFDNG